jgi:hypothetical protein
LQDLCLEILVQEIRLVLGLEGARRIDAQHLTEASTGDRQLADQIEQAIQALDVDAQGAVRRRRRRHLDDHRRGRLSAGLARLAAAPALELGEERRARDGDLVGTGGGERDELAHRVERIEDHGDQRRAHLEAAVGQAGEHVLEQVREPGQALETQARGVALERVRRAEDLLEHDPVARLALERDDALLHRRQLLLGLAEERLQERVTI